MREAVIVEGVRTPVGRKNGLLKDIRADDLAAEALKALVKRAGLKPEMIDDVILGCVSQIGEQTGDIARVAALIAGFPIEVPGTTIDRQCGSSQQAVHFAAQAILAGDMDIVIAGGVESMSRVPIGSSYQGVGFSEKLTDRHEIIHQGLSAERIAEKYGFTREELDRYSFESHQKALNAQAEGRFEREIEPLDVTMSDGQLLTVTEDAGPRKETSLEALASLKTVFKENGVIHAGNSSQISDGAAALLIMSREKAEELGMKPKFRILARMRLLLND